MEKGHIFLEADSEKQRQAGKEKVSVIKSQKRGLTSDMLSATSCVLGLLTMVLFKPRSWCVCRLMGAMTQMICNAKASGKSENM